MQCFERTTPLIPGTSCLPESDSALVRLARHDTRAFGRLYERYRDDVFRYALYCLRNWDDAADATQQTFTNALAGLSGFQDNDDSFRNWLFCIARNEVITRHRQRARRSEYRLTELDWIPDDGRSPEELAILADSHTRLCQLLLRLPPEQRRCCSLRFAGMSCPEIAITLGKSEGAVRASCSRGFAALRSLISAAENDQTRTCLW